MKKRKLLKTDDKYEIFINRSENDQFYAAEGDQRVELNSLLREYRSFTEIPDRFKMLCYKVEKIKDLDDIEEYNIINWKKVEISFNKLESALIGYQD